MNSFFVFIAHRFFSRTTVKKSSSLTLQAPLVDNWARVFQEATNQFLFNRRTSLLLFPSSCPSSLRQPSCANCSLQLCILIVRGRTVVDSSDRRFTTLAEVITRVHSFYDFRSGCQNVLSTVVLFQDSNIAWRQLSRYPQSAMPLIAQLHC